ncbi:class II fructose-bisphosphate aldolase [bacterium]|nr:class II fructose-bisphosphate aldolase [bacterium]
MKSLKYFFKKAKKEKWAIGQFNFSTLEQLKAIVSAAERLKSPVILGTSQGEVNFFGIEEATLLRDLYRKKFPYIYLNLDHGKDIDLIKKAIDLGYDCVHFDGSILNLQENLKITNKIVKYAHKKGCLVEGEIKSIHGGSEIHKELPKEVLFEDIEKAKEFVKKTDIDSLAINIGNLHGVYKKPIRLNIKHLKKIKEEISVFLVLHGGSGTSKKDIKEAIKNGVVKINVNTELRIAWKKSLTGSLKKKIIKPYKILPPVIKAISDLVQEKIGIFESINKN